jgi:hypothetical protein
LDHLDAVIRAFDPDCLLERMAARRRGMRPL